MNVRYNVIILLKGHGSTWKINDPWRWGMQSWKIWDINCVLWWWQRWKIRKWEKSSNRFRRRAILGYCSVTADYFLSFLSWFRFLLNSSCLHRFKLEAKHFNSELHSWCVTQLIAKVFIIKAFCVISQDKTPTFSGTCFSNVNVSWCLLSFMTVN